MGASLATEVVICCHDLVPILSPSPLPILRPHETSMQTCSMRLFSNAFVFNYATRSAILSVRGHKKYVSGRSAFIQDVNATYTARRCVLPGKFTWRLSIILQHAQTPSQGQCFEISQTMSPKPQILNPKPKTLKPKTLKSKTLNPKT